MTNTYTCAVHSCKEPAVFYVKIAKKLKPVCLKHFHRIKVRGEKSK